MGWAHAVTVSDSSDSVECKKTSNPVETTLCAIAHTTVTYNNPSPAGVVNITVDSSYIDDGGGIAWFWALECGGGGGGSCTSSNVRTNVNGWGNIYYGGGTVSPTLSPGTYPIWLDVDVYHPSGTGCVWFGDSNCVLLDLGSNSGGTLTVEAAASVNLNISQWFDKVLKNIFSAFVADVAQARGW